MLFTWSTKDLCIVFRGWHIDSTFTLIWSLLAVVALGAGYELVRNITRQYEARTAARLETMPRKSPLYSSYVTHILLAIPSWLHWLST